MALAFRGYGRGVGDGQVRVTITVDIADRDSKGGVAAGEGGAGGFLERPVALAEQYRTIIAFEVSGDEVGFAVLVDIRRSQSLVRPFADGIKGLVIETHVGVAKYDRYFVLGPVVGGHIETAVAVKVGDSDPMGMGGSIYDI